MAIGVRPKGEAVAFGVFGGIAFIGFLLSFGITGSRLEADGWSDDGSDDEAVSDSGSDDEHATLVGGRSSRSDEEAGSRRHGDASTNSA